MNKYILQYSEKINESIGKGSVLLIKGRPNRDGRFLYVTTITGYAEIKPGIKMVFIGDTIYRVIHKGGDKFSGRKVDYRGEDGLKGVLNMKTPGKPSVVLNHNKTPFHWITLDHTDIGSALRAIGTRLFNHELILESENREDVHKPANDFIVREVIKLITGQETILNLMGVDINEGGEDILDIEDDEGSITGYETEAELILTIKESNVPPEFLDYFTDLGIINFDFGSGLDIEDLDLIGFNTKNGVPFQIRYETEAQVRHTYDPGDYWTPPSGDSEVENVESFLYREGYGNNSKIDPFTLDGEPVSIPDDMKSEIDIYEKMIEDLSPDEIIGDLEDHVYGKVKRIAGIERDTNITRQLKLLYYNYTKALVDLNKNGLSPEARKRWERLDSLNLDEILKKSEEIDRLNNELVEIDKDPNQELTQEQINQHLSYVDMIKDMVPPSRAASGGYVFAASTNRGEKIGKINIAGIKSTLTTLGYGIKNGSEHKRLEKELMNINYLKAKDNVLKKQHPPSLIKREEKLDFYLNPRT